MQREEMRNLPNKNKKNDKIIYHGGFLDYSMIILVLFLVCFGIIMIYSASSYKGSQMTPPQPAYWAKRQAVFAVLGFLAMILVSKINYHILQNIALTFYVFVILLVLYTTLFGIESGGAKRWISVAGIRFQPNEIAKGCLIIFLAFYINKIFGKKSSTKMMAWSIGVALPLIGIVGKENMSTAMILFFIAALMIFVANPKTIQFVVLLGIGVVLGTIMILAAPYRQGRVSAWLHPELGTSDEAYQTMQSLYAIGSGGFWGKGLGKSMQKLGFVPEAHNDMIFSIICEELGLFGAICVILLFLMLIWRIFQIALYARDIIGGMIATGVMAHIASQVLINVAVATNTMPNTGVPLPFVSYGGTSLTFLMIEMGLVLSVGRQIKINS